MEREREERHIICILSFVNKFSDILPIEYNIIHMNIRRKLTPSHLRMSAAIFQNYGWPSEIYLLPKNIRVYTNREVRYLLTHY